MRRIPPTFGVDTNDRLDVNRLLLGGVKFICRYHSDDGFGRNLTRPEADLYKSRRLPMVSVWENGKSEEVILGYQSGVRCATQANLQQAYCGGLGQPIYFACDFIGNAQKIVKMQEFFKGVRSVIGYERIGVYGTYYTVQTLIPSYCNYGWQTNLFEEWTGPEQWSHYAGLRQYANARPSINGLDNFGATTYLCYDHATTYNYGQWL